MAAASSCSPYKTPHITSSWSFSPLRLLHVLGSGAVCPCPLPEPPEGPQVTGLRGRPSPARFRSENASQILPLLAQMQQKNQLFSQLGNFLSQVQQEGSTLEQQTKEKLRELEAVSVQRDKMRDELHSAQARLQDLGSANEQMRTTTRHG